jgi:glutamate N-acetyltransferase/amino-acid N-acetyltransferase
MTVTAPRGFRASGVTAGLKESGRPDLALVVNDGPSQVAAGRFTGNRVKAAPVKWSQQVLTYGRLKAVVLNSGGANACTGPEGFQDTHATAEKVADLLGCGAAEVAVCSTGLIGERLPMDRLLPGVDAAAAALAEDGGEDAAAAIMTTDTVPKNAVRTGEEGWTIGGIAKGAGMLAPGLATMLVVLTTDAVVDAELADEALGTACRYSFDRLDVHQRHGAPARLRSLGDRGRSRGVHRRAHRAVPRPGAPAAERRGGIHQGHRRHRLGRRDRGRRARGRPLRRP